MSKQSALSRLKNAPHKLFTFMYKQDLVLDNLQ